MSLEDMIVEFIVSWSPKRSAADKHRFIHELRTLLEAYGVAALVHGNLPDTEHQDHGGGL
jgi:hypothetical protein